jgi:hypothetical protein
MGIRRTKMTDQVIDADIIAPLPWMIEFKQDYTDGLSVRKRGIDATPMVIRKYDIAANEVMTFSSHEKRSRAISVFHFHPTFPFEARQQYMTQHAEGYEVAHNVQIDLETESRKRRSKRKNKLKSAGRSIALTLHSLVLYILFHHPDTR